MDTYVLNTQNWLKTTYKNNDVINSLALDAHTGQDTITALVAALQIELGLSNPNGSFGPATTVAVERLGIIKVTSDSEKPSNIIKIIQGACYCKGYDAGGGLLTGIHTMTGSGLAIAIMKNDMGLVNNNGDVGIQIWKVLLSMKQFKVLSSYGGSEQIQNIQQNLNRIYFNYIGEYVACDGICQRDTISGIIYAIQKEEGINVNDANGVFGPTTSSLWPTLTSGSNSKFVKILQWCLFINGYTQFNIFTTNFDSSTLNSIKRFQAFMALTVNGICDSNLMKYLLLSSGNPYRDVDGCDSSTPLTQSRINVLRGYDYNIVGRYISHGYINGTDKYLMREEVELILSNGMSIFPIYQTSANYYEYFDSPQGSIDASNAINNAINLGFPNGTVIYFAVDYDFMEGEIGTTVLPYFKTISSKFREDGNFRVGIYASRNICSIISRYGYATYSFVSGMSTGFSGNLGFPMPNNWSFNQILTVNVSDFQIDNNAVSGRDTGVSYIDSQQSTITSQNEICLYQLKNIYDTAYEYTSYDIQKANLLTTQVIRYSTYSSNNWEKTGGTTDLKFYEQVKEVINYKPFYELYDPESKIAIGYVHFMATLNANIYDSGLYRDLLTIMAGWGGDLVTMAESITGDTDQARLSNAIQLLGTFDFAASNFSYQDVLADIDAVNVAHILRTSPTVSIYDAVKSYYTENVKYEGRFSSFMINDYASNFNNFKHDIDVITGSLSDNPIIWEIRHAISNANSQQLKAANNTFYNYIHDKCVK